MSVVITATATPTPTSLVHAEMGICSLFGATVQSKKYHRQWLINWGLATTLVIKTCMHSHTPIRMRLHKLLLNALYIYIYNVM